MNFTSLTENIVEILGNKKSVLPTQLNAISFDDYVNEKFGVPAVELTLQQLDDASLEFVGKIIGINNNSADALIPLTGEEIEKDLNNFLQEYHVEKFDNNLNYYKGHSKVSLKEVIIELYNSMKVGGTPFITFNSFDLRPLINRE